jgi:gliding motility-associated-like protein
LIADCDGNFYLFNASGNNATPYLRKYSSSGTLLQSWTVVNPNNYRPSGGFAIAGTSFYTDQILLSFLGIPLQTGVASGILNGPALDLNAVSTAMPPYNFGAAFYLIGDLASCDAAIPRLAEITIASSDTAFCGAREVDYWVTDVQNPGPTPTYQWFVNGNPVAGATDTFYEYTPQNGDAVTCQLTSSDYCVAIVTATSNPITMLVDNAIQPILSYNPNEFCTDVATTVLPTVNTTGGTFTATAGLSIDAGTGEITPSSSVPGEYIITYMNPPPVKCPQYSTTAIINVYPPADATIQISDFRQPICLNDTIVLQANEAIGNLYSWQPVERVIGPKDQPTAIAGRDKAGYVSLTVYAKGGCMDKDSVLVDMGKSCCQIFVPGAFTPNNDALNDFVEIEAKDIQAITGIRIFNRYGQVVFEGKNTRDKWDGTKDGKLCDVGVYYYLLSYSCDDGKLLQKKGDITLVR